MLLFSFYGILLYRLFYGKICAVPHKIKEITTWSKHLTNSKGTEHCFYPILTNATKKEEKVEYKGK